MLVIVFAKVQKNLIIQTLFPCFFIFFITKGRMHHAHALSYNNY